MDRTAIINRIGIEYHTPNIEGGEYSYVAEAGSKQVLVSALNREPKHFKLDIRFEMNDVVILVETKQKFTKKDESQLKDYLDEERALHSGKKIICILANTKNDKIKVWKQTIDDDGLLVNETVLETMEYYKGLFTESKQNNREKVLRNTYELNELLHKKDIDEKLRSQFVGTILLYIKDTISKKGYTLINDKVCNELKSFWSELSERQICTGIEDTLDGLLNGSENKEKKISLIKTNILKNQKVKKLSISDWIVILDTITRNIYAYIDSQSSEGQDILNLFFIAFNKYTGKADKNQAFTPDHITEFMCRITDIDRTKRVFDGTCGSGSFLVQALVKKMADCFSMKGTSEQKLSWAETVKREHIYGIEIEENAYGLATTNMLIHGDGNSNIILGNLFEHKEFVKSARPDVILMNPPYNAKPISIPELYKKNWGKKAKDGKEDPTKGLVFIQFISDCIKEMNELKIQNGETKTEVKLAVLLPVAVAIGASSILKEAKHKILEDNTLEAVFTLPNEIFYPGASASACCMVFTLGKPHINSDGTINKTFFGYYKEDGFKKKRNLGRVEQFDKDGNSLWKQIEEDWISMYRNKTVIDGLSAMEKVNGDDEWLCEAYMETDYSVLTQEHFATTIREYASFLVKINKAKSHSTQSQNNNVKPVQTKLNIEEWQYFYIDEIFDSIIPTQGDVTENLADGNEIPYIAAKKESNGLDKMCSKKENIEYISKGNCIVFIQLGQGSAGYSLYQEHDFIGMSGKTSCGYSDDLNVWRGLFLVSILDLERCKFSFGRSWTGDRLTKTRIKLPTIQTESGFVPDWEFMEKYMKNLNYAYLI